MEKLRAREHDFGSKLRQASVIETLKAYVLWQRSGRMDAFPAIGPISINLDLTSACNFACPHCVDSTILHARKTIALEDIKKTVRHLHGRGLKSVILLGGGEPTLHPDIEEIVAYLKRKKLQLGIVTNGSKVERLAGALHLLQEKDWVRISIDAAGEKTFQALHRPRVRTTLRNILEKAGGIKKVNPAISLGYSFVIVWKGLSINGRRLKSNVSEMPAAVELGREYGFDYISFKPCLIRLARSERESLLDNVGPDRERMIAQEIQVSLDAAKASAHGAIKVLESVNLRALLDQKADEIKQQPERCHMQFFRTVVSPSGVFHCPAFRGIEKAKLGEKDGYAGRRRLETILKTTADSIMRFNAREECRVVGCFYHQSNWWLDRLIASKRPIDDLATVEDDNFFL
jgi:MoaA/NifB/PqqE/SkfB family radical SAM enzyme